MGAFITSAVAMLSSGTAWLSGLGFMAFFGRLPAKVLITVVSLAVFAFVSWYYVNGLIKGAVGADRRIRADQVDRVTIKRRAKADAVESETSRQQHNNQISRQGRAAVRDLVIRGIEKVEKPDPVEAETIDLLNEIR